MQHTLTCQNVGELPYQLSPFYWEVQLSSCCTMPCLFHIDIRNLDPFFQIPDNSYRLTISVILITLYMLICYNSEHYIHVYAMYCMFTYITWLNTKSKNYVISLENNFPTYERYNTICSIKQYSVCKYNYKRVHTNVWE